MPQGHGNGHIEEQVGFREPDNGLPRTSLKLKDTAKRLSAQYLKEGYADEILEGHLDTAAPGVSKNDFIVMDGTDIGKKHAKFTEGLKFVKNGDTGEIWLGYNVLNINPVNADREISPLLSRAYSYEMGAGKGNMSPTAR